MALHLGDILPGRCFGECSALWVSERATFGDGCFGQIVYLVALVALLALLSIPLRSTVAAYTPLWLSNFAEEETKTTELPSERPAAHWTKPAVRLLLGSLAQVVLGVAASVFLDTPLFLLPVVPGVVSALMMIMDPPRMMHAPFLTLQIALFAVQYIVSLTEPVRNATSLELGCWVVQVVLSIFALLDLTTLPMRDPFRDNSEISVPFAVPITSEMRSPEDNFSMWNWMSVDWILPLIKLGRERQLEDEDVWQLPLSFHHERLFTFLRELKGSWLWRILKVNGRDVVFTTLLDTILACSWTLQVLVYKYALAALRTESRDVPVAIVYVSMTLGLRSFGAFLSVFELWFLRRVYERSRGELIVLVYEKTQRRKVFTFSGVRAAESPADDVAAEVPADEATGSAAESEAATQSQSQSQSQAQSLVQSPSQPGSDGGAASVSTAYDDTTPLLIKPNGAGKGSTGATKATTASGWRRFVGRLGRWITLRTSHDSVLKVESKTPASVGKILDLIKHDSYQIAGCLWCMSNLLTNPLRLGLSLYLISDILGPAAFSGIMIIVGAQIIDVVLSRVMVRWQRARRVYSDQKLSSTTNFVQALRHLRWYDWQDKWMKLIVETRRKELLLYVVCNSLDSLMNAVNYASSTFFPVVAFYTYTVLAGNKLTVEIAFPALTLCETVNDALRAIPEDIKNLIDAWVSMKRIESFMQEPDKEGADADTKTEPERQLALELVDASVSWPGTTYLTLKHVSAAFPVGLTLVRGQVGSGKTALMLSILSEMDRRSGEVRVPNEMIGFCNQSPWLQSLSIRDNILFSSVMDLDRYKTVLHACCLVPDLATFKGGDLAQIGEKGVGLSGGQKARVALARAVYSRARVLLLDDPIAALDHDTAETVLARLSGNELLKDRIVVFATHRIDLVLPYAVQVLEVEDGMVRQVRVEDVRASLVLPSATAAARPGPEGEEAAEGGERGTAEEQGGDNQPKDSDVEAVMPEKFIEEERRTEGSVVASVYLRYVRFGSPFLWAMYMLTLILIRFSDVLHFYFLKFWGEAYSTTVHILTLTTTFFLAVPHQAGARAGSAGGGFLDRLQDYLGLPNPQVDVRPWLYWFSVVAVFRVVVQLLDSASHIAILYVSGRRIYTRVLATVTGATFRYYDVTPVGRLLNRLTSDLSAVDGSVLSTLRSMAWYAFGWLSALLVIGSTTPTFLVLALVTSAGFVFLFRFYFPATQSLRRLEMARLSPLFSDVTNLMEGLLTVRAFKSQIFFRNRMFRTNDLFQSMDHFYWSCQNWLQLRFSLLSSFSTFLLSVFAITGGLSDGTVAFLMSAAAGFMSSTHNLCKTYGSMQMKFVSVERLMELLDIEQEPAGDVVPPAGWPGFSDDIVFDDVTLRYAAHMDPAVHNISFRVPAGASLAVIGRTGSGKSTLALALLGTILPDAGGRITIGAVSVAEVQKRALRQRVSFVAQDPVLFTGPMRDNLDPNHEHSEEECAAVLERALGSTFRHDGGGQPLTLDFHVDAGGLNLSQGQRQLMGLARAVLRRSAVVILDEATASIDTKTARDIQSVLRTELRHSTVITIAHRAEAVLDADYVLEMNAGAVKSFRAAREINIDDIVTE